MLEMSVFDPAVEDLWMATFLSGDVLSRTANLTVVANPALPAGREAMVLRVSDDRVYAVLSPILADTLSIGGRSELTEATLRQKLLDGKVQLHGADYVFHFTQDSKQALLQEQVPMTVRLLNAADSAIFSRFEASASAQDLDDAYVELDHWAVFGAFEAEHLVCAASMYPWNGQKVADIGVLTLPPHRGKGHARRVVRAISRHAFGQGYEPQYRCQMDNAASVALARSAGLELFGMWEVALDALSS